MGTTVMKFTREKSLKIANSLVAAYVFTGLLPSSAVAGGEAQGTAYIESQAIACSFKLTPDPSRPFLPNEVNSTGNQEKSLTVYDALWSLQARSSDKSNCSLLTDRIVPQNPSLTNDPNSEIHTVEKDIKTFELIENYLSSVSSKENCKQDTTKPSCLYIVELATRTSSFLKVLSGGQERYEYLGENSNDRDSRIIPVPVSDTPSWDFNFPEDAFRSEALAIRNNGGPNDESQYMATLCDTECQERGLSVARLLPISSFILENQQKIIQAPIKTKVNSTLTPRESQWSAYAFGGGQDRVQLPWEIKVNSYFYLATKQPEAIPLVPGSNKDQLVGLNELGKNFAWPDPPKGAWTFLHPSVGYAPFRSNGKPSSLGITVEAIGYSWWKYSDKGARTNEWGLSIGAAWHNLEGNDDISPALVIRTPLKLMGSTPLTLAISTPRNEQRKRETLVSLNVDLNKLFSTDGAKDSGNLRARIEQLFGFKK